MQMKCVSVYLQSLFLRSIVFILIMNMCVLTTVDYDSYINSLSKNTYKKYLLLHWGSGISLGLSSRPKVLGD